MHYGLNLPNAAVDASTLVQFGALAERAGWDGVFLEDYIVYQNRQDIPTHDPWVILAGMALGTERIRLGTEVTALVRRRPWKLAREAATLDHLSGGRLTLGAGLGDSADMSFTRFGEEMDARERAAMLDEALDVLAGLWSGKPFSYQGKHYRVDEVTFHPPPVQRPRVPIWIGGGYPLPGPTRRAARWDGACLYKHPPGENERPMMPEDVRAVRRFMDSHRSFQGPFDIVVGGQRRSGDSEAERDHIRSVREAGATWWVEWVPPDEPEVMRTAIARGPLWVS